MNEQKVPPGAWQKIIISALLGLGISSYLLGSAGGEGSVLNSAMTAMIVAAVIAFIALLIKNQNKINSVNQMRWVDAIAAVPVLIFLACPWWMVATHMPTNRASGGATLPIQLIVFLTDVIPAAFGLFWLIFRNAKKQPRPLLMRPFIMILLIFVFLIIPLISMRGK
jgi:amino acid transporter